MMRPVAKRSGEVRRYGEREVKVTNLHKVLFPDDGITKGQVLDYVVAVADAMLPGLRDRALSMERWPDGLAGDGFFHKHVPKHFPDWVRTATLPTSQGPMQQVVVDDLAGLVLVTNFGCLTPHVPTATVDRPFHPSELVVDLDPSTDDLDDLRGAAGLVRGLLDEVGLPSFPRWTGSKGIHVVVPLDRSADAEAVFRLATGLAERLVGRHPARFTTAFKKVDRGPRIYVDVGRNLPMATAVASWALRARPGAPVAMPVAWDEVASTGPRHFTLRTAPARVGLEVWPAFEASRAAAGAVELPGG